MFGALKKKLQEAVKKVSKAVSEDRPVQEKEVTEAPKEQPLEKEIRWMEKRAKDTLLDFEKPPEKELILHKEPAPLEEMKEKEDEILKEKEKLDAIIRKDAEPETTTQEKEFLAPEMTDFEKHELMAEEGKKKSLFSGLIKKVSEKRLEEKDVDKVARELHLTLLENDVSMETADRISEDLKKELVGKNVPRGKMEDAIKDALRNSMLDVLRQEKPDINKLIKEKRGEPFVIVFLGFNGTGKTTNLSKLASMMKEHRPVLAAADTFRAASIEQLEEHGRRLGMKVVKHTYGSDSAAVIFDAKKHAAASGSRLVLADTAGRSHANVNLMDELKKICRVNKPDMKILVLDSLTGNDIYDQVNLFNDAVGIDGIILSKADVYDKGGAALSAAHTSKKPILYLGTGQNYEDLKEFDPEEIINSLLE